MVHMRSMLTQCNMGHTHVSDVLLGEYTADCPGKMRPTVCYGIGPVHEKNSVFPMRNRFSHLTAHNSNGSISGCTHALGTPIPVTSRAK